MRQEKPALSRPPGKHLAPVHAPLADKEAVLALAFSLRRLVLLALGVVPHLDERGEDGGEAEAECEARDERAEREQR